MNILIVDLEDSINSSSTIFKKYLYQGLGKTHNIKIVLRKNSEIIEKVSGAEFIEVSRVSDFFNKKSNNLSKVIYHLIKRSSKFIKRYFLFGVDLLLIFSVRRKISFLLKDSNIDLVLTVSHPIESHFSVPSKNKYRIMQYWFEQWYINPNEPISTYAAKKIRKLAINKSQSSIYSNTTLLKENSILSNKSSFVIGLISSDEHKLNNLINQNIEFGYYGNFNPKIRNIDHLYEALKRTNQSSLIVGNGKELLSENKLKVINKRISGLTVKFYEESTKNLFVILNNQHNAWPGKLYSYSSLSSIIIVLYDLKNDIHLEIKKEFEYFENFIFLENKLSSITTYVDSRKPQVKTVKNNKFHQDYVINEFNQIFKS